MPGIERGVFFCSTLIGGSWRGSVDLRGQHHITQTGYSPGVGSPPLAVTVALMDSRYTRRLVDPRSASMGRDPACERS